MPTITIHRVALLLLLAFAVAPLAAAKDMPTLPEKFDGLVGTWKHDYAYEGKDLPLYLVIKRDGKGRLQFRYQLPMKSKKYTSNWEGKIKVQLQVAMTEQRKLEFRTAVDPPRIEVSEQIRFTSTWKAPKLRQETVVELRDDGDLQRRCVSVIDEGNRKKKLPCPKPLVYHRVSTDTDWPD